VKDFIAQSKNSKVGFTLIELLIVIAILAILATIVLLVINPVEMFAQARDSQRIYDISTLSNATALYLTTVSGSTLQGQGSNTFECGTHYGGSVNGAVEYFKNSPTLYVAFTRKIDGTDGWVPVKYSSIPGGAPISSLPIDPVNTFGTEAYNYTYACENQHKWFEFDANMESERYRNGGGDDVESTDGGDNIDVYEVGNDPGLDL